MLQDSDISLHTLGNGKFLTVGTVHQLTVFEYDHVAVHQDVLDCVTQEKESPSVPCDHIKIKSFFVALTRHRCSLTILYDINPCFHDTEPENSIFKVQQSIIFSSQTTHRNIAFVL